MLPKQAQETSIVLRIPDEVSLTYAPTPWRATKRANFKTLPVDILLLILQNLHYVDCICLGLTCKYLASIVSIVPKLNSSNLTSFTDRSYCFLEPRTYDLLPRLAHGWVPKDRFGWCPWCFKIRSRNEKYWKSRLYRGGWLDWLPRLSFPGRTCVFTSRKAQYERLIKEWRDARPQYGLRVRCAHCCSDTYSHFTCQSVYCPECAAKALIPA